MKGKLNLPSKLIFVFRAEHEQEISRQIIYGITFAVC